MDIQDIIKTKTKEFSDLVKASLTKEEMLNAFKTMIEHLKRMEQRLNVEMGMLENKYTEKVNSIKENYGGDMAGMKKEAMDFCMSEMDKLKGQIDAKMAEVKDGVDGLNADVDEVAQKASEIACGEVLKQIPTIEAIEGDLPKLGDKIRDALELLNGEDKLRVEAIAGLEEYLKGRGGKSGGFSLNSLNMHIVDDEVPSGTKNSINTDFILTNTPQPLSSLKVYRGGARQQVNPTGTTDGDYSINNRTITFNIAPASGEIILCDYRS